MLPLSRSACSAESVASVESAKSSGRVLPKPFVQASRQPKAIQDYTWVVLSGIGNSVNSVYRAVIRFFSLLARFCGVWALLEMLGKVSGYDSRGLLTEAILKLPKGHAISPVADDIQDFLEQLGRHPIEDLGCCGYQRESIDLGHGYYYDKWETEGPNNWDDAQVFHVGPFELTGAEVKSLVDSSLVRYSPEAGLTASTLAEMINKGAREDQYTLARYRSVAGDVVLVRDAEGNPVQREAGAPLMKARVYCQSAPNLRYGTDSEIAEFIVDGEFATDKYKDDTKRNLKLFFDSCLADGVSVPVLPGFGLGAFMPEGLKNKAADLFGIALAELIKENGDKYSAFTAVVFADYRTIVRDLVARELEIVQNQSGLPRILVSDASPLAVAQAGAKLGLKVGLLNAADPSCQTGQLWEHGKIALDEVFALCTTMMLKHQGISERTRDPQCYQQQS